MATPPTQLVSPPPPPTKNLTTRWEVNASDLSMSYEIGRGTFGVVTLATLHGMQVAVKTIGASATTAEKNMAAAMLQREVKALSFCRHKNIVPLIGACSNPPMLVLAYAAQGTLRDLLRNNYDTLLPERKMKLLRSHRLSGNL